MATGKAKKKPLRGVFITFEGIDGCGKTTQARLLAQRLREGGHPVLETREPGGTAIGAALREVLLAPAHGAMTPQCELLLYLADRLQHLAETIRPALEKGETVVCDRFHDATVAYQHHGRGLDFTPVRELIEREIAPAAPQVTFWLDAPPAQAARRMAGREQAGGLDAAATRLDREHQAFHLRVKAGYEALARDNPRRIVRIDADRPIAVLAEEIWQRLGERYAL